MKKAIALLLALVLMAGGLGGLAQANPGSLQAYHQRFQSAYVDPVVDAIGFDMLLNGNYRWHFHIANDSGAAVSVPTIRVDSTLDPNLFPAVDSWPFTRSIPSLGPGERWVMMDLGSDLPVTFALGYDSSRTMLPLEIPPGTSVQTITVRVKPIDARYVDSFMRVGVAGNVVPDSNTQPAEAQATINSEGQPGIVWVIHQSQPGIEYIFIVQLQVENPSDAELVHKPAVQVYVEPAEFLGDVTGTSTTIDDPVLQGAATYSVADAPLSLWHRVLAEPYLVQYGGTGEPGEPGGNVEVDFTTAYRHTADGDLVVSVANGPLEGSKETNAGIWNNANQPVVDPVLTFIPADGVEIENVMWQDLVSESPYTWALATIPVGGGLRRFAWATADSFEFTPGFSTSRTLSQIEFTADGTQQLIISTTVEEEMLWLNILVQIPDDDLVDASVTGATGDGDLNHWPQGVEIRINDPIVGTTYSQTVNIDVTLKVGVDSASFKPRIHVDAGNETDSGYVDGTSVSGTTELGTWEWTTAANYPWHWVNGLVKGVIFPEVQLGPLPQPLPDVNEVDFEYHTWWSYTPPGDTFTNGEVTGTTSWLANVDNRPDGTGGPISGLQLGLDSTLALDWTNSGVPLTAEGPGTYEWAFSDVPQGETAGVWVHPTNPDAFPATFTPGFDASQAWGNVEFSQVGGAQTQTLTIVVTPQEAMEGFLIIVAADDNPFILIDKDDLVEAVIVSFPDGGDVSPDGHSLVMGVPAGEVGVPVATTVEIQVMPNVPRVEYRPAVWVVAVEEVIDHDVDVPLGNSHSLEVPPLGTWTWNAEGEYRLTWTEIVFKAVTFPELQSGIESFAIETMSVDFDRHPNRDKIAISEATFSLRDDAAYDLAVDDVTVIVDGVVITIPAGSFTRDDDDEDEEEYEFKSDEGDGPKVHMEIDFDKGEWSFKVSKLDASAIDNYDGVDVTLIIGFMVARERINMRVGGLTYIAAE